MSGMTIGASRRKLALITTSGGCDAHIEEQQ